MSKCVLVTGGSGFVGSHCIAELLKRGYIVRTTVRSEKKKLSTLEALREAGIDHPANLSFVEADLLSDRGWLEAVRGCDYVLHVASPFPASVPKDENELIRPAKEGTLRVLKFARDAGVKRVVVTSSSVAVTYGHSARSTPFTEETWTNIDNPIVPPYPKSKTIAEKAAWEFMKMNGGALQLSVVNPVGIFGPVLGKELSASIQIVKMMLEGLPAFPKLTMNVVDVRDLADLQIRAMEHPAAAGQRFLADSDGTLSLREIGELLRERLGDQAKRVSVRSIPDWVIRIMALFARDLRAVIPELGNVKNASNAKAKSLLGWTPRAKEDAVLATAESLLKLGLVKQKR